MFLALKLQFCSLVLLTDRFDLVTKDMEPRDNLPDCIVSILLLASKIFPIHIFCSIRVYKIAEIGNNGNIGITRKQKKKKKIHTPGHQAFGFDALLPALSRHVLIGRCKIFKWSCSTGSQCSTCLDISERRALDMNGGGPRFNTNCMGETIYYWIFCFHVKLLPNLCICQKLDSLLFSKDFQFSMQSLTLVLHFNKGQRLSSMPRYTLIS